MSIDWKTSANSIAASIQRATQKLMQDKGVQYTPPANQGMTSEQASNQPKYSGAQNVVGNMTQGGDLGKTNQSIFQGLTAKDPTRTSLNTWTDKSGSVYDTTNMTPQQSYALQLNKEGNTNAESILRGMGYDINGNAFVPTSAANPPTSPLGSVAPSGVTPNPASPTPTPTARFNPNADPSERLAEFARNPQSAQNEINIVKQMYQQEKDAGATPERLAQIHDWANQVRSVSGIADDNVPAQGIATGGATSPTGAALSPEDNIHAKIKAMSDEKVKADKAVFDQQANDAKTKLEKIYADAVASGEMSKREADAALASEKAQINQQAYQNGQDRNVIADQRGIGNSQQLLGMQATDNALANTATNTATATRDKALADIQTRMANLLTNKQLDMQQVDNTYNANLNKSQADATAQAMDKSVQFDIGNYQFDKQQAATLSNMSMQQSYDLAKMAFGSKLDVDKMDKAQVLDLAKMAVAQGYKIDDMKMSFSQELTKMATQNGYAKELQNASFEQQKTLKGIEQAGQLDLLKKKLEASNADLEDQYKIAVNRELDKYTPGTPEYTIRENQLKDAKDKAKSDLFTKAVTDFQVKDVMTDPNFSTTPPVMAPPKTSLSFNLFDNLANYFKTGSMLGDNSKATDEYNKKKSAYDRWLELNK